MQADEVVVTFGPTAGDRGLLSKSALTTLDAIYCHPISHNLEWSDVVALFEKLGSVVRKSHNEVAFAIGDEHHLMRKPHTKDLTASEVMQFRHLLTRSGWSPSLSSAGAPGPSTITDIAETTDEILVVVEQHEARLYHLDMRGSPDAKNVMRPYGPHRVLHHLAHKGQSREGGGRATEDTEFYKGIAQAIATARRIVVIGHGDGHSNAAHCMIGYLKVHCHRTYQNVACELVADLSSATPSELLVLARHALSS